MLVETLIQRIKADPNYVLDPALSQVDVATEVLRRSVSLVRGLWAWRFVRGSKLRFAESGTEIRHRRHLRAGSGSVLEAHARLHCLSKQGFYIGQRVTIGKFAIVECSSVLWKMGQGFSIGNDSSVGDYSFIGCGGGVHIGNNVLMGQRVAIHSQNHLFQDAGVLIRSQGVSNEGVVIGNDCWLGSGSVVLDGVTLGDGCVVAAGAVVTKSFPPNSVLGGIPARVISKRTLEAEALDG